MRTSCSPETEALQASDPSTCRSAVCPGCQLVSATRAATSGEKRTTTRTIGSSEMTSQAASSSRAMVVLLPSNVSGVSDASTMRSTLNVRLALRLSSRPMRYSARVNADGSMAYGWTRVTRGGFSSSYTLGP